MLMPEAVTLRRSICAALGALCLLGVNACGSTSAGSSPNSETTAGAVTNTSASNSSTAGDSGSSGGASSVTGSTTTTGAATELPTTPGNVVLVGAFAPLPEYGEAGFVGRAVLHRSWEETTASVHLLGLEPDTDYVVRVHRLPCTHAEGERYKLDPSVAASDASNEIWSAFTTDAMGTGTSATTVEHRVRGDALSVVLHDPNANDAQLACADLDLGSYSEQRPVALGGFASFADAEEGDAAISGTASMQLTADGTTISLSLSGLDSSAEYSARLHDLPCDVMNAGGPYEIDPDLAPTSEENELWLSVAVDDEGNASDELTSPHRVRFDAQSVVLQRGADGEAPKVACADLMVNNYPRASTSSFESVVFDDSDIERPSAELQRFPTGETSVTLGLHAYSLHAAYPVCVHTLPCTIEAGGAVYEIDPTVAEIIESNEVCWVSDMAQQPGGYWSTTLPVPHVLRAEARSLVLYESSKVKLACFDLD